MRNCAPYIAKVFANIKKVTSIFDDFHIIVSFDISQDNTLALLKQQQLSFGVDKMDILINTNALSPIRVERISNSRNCILNRIREIVKCDSTWDYFIMLDCDDVCAYKLDENVLKSYLTRCDWDALSFNRNNYYDAWALSFDNYLFSCWNFDNPRKVIADMKNALKIRLSALKPDELYQCHSAFDGFAIYRLQKFIDCEYKWIIDFKHFPRQIMDENIKLCGSNPHLRSPNEDCEHRSFHLQAIIKNQAKIMISPLSIFDN